MTHSEPWPRIAVVGAGAVGCYFGGMLARAGAPVTLIGREPHVSAINGNGLMLDTTTFAERVWVPASAELDAARDADIVLFCVKTLDTEKTAAQLASLIGVDTVVVSLQNGVDNVDRIRAAAGIDAIGAAVYVASAMVDAGHVRQTARGDLVIGTLPWPKYENAVRGDPARIAELFARGSVPCVVTDNIAGALWTKLILNSAFNAVSALSRARYGRIAGFEPARKIVRYVVEESLAVAAAAGVVIPGDDVLAAAYKLGAGAPQAFASTAQDIFRGKTTEIDALNGFVASRGDALGVPTPVNHTLFALVKLLEQSLGEFPHVTP